ncbi:hypothetical protein SVAN01_06034 [Stagonosporopsis vannaccii]|nr:hypothetical protein SVAN01_06034 [Stagonosporopsis vannaccii]
MPSQASTTMFEQLEDPNQEASSPSLEVSEDPNAGTLRNMGLNGTVKASKTKVQKYRSRIETRKVTLTT